MIDKALSFILAELNAFLSARIQSNEQLAILSSLANPDGTTPPGLENKLVLSLVNIEREPAAPTLGVNTTTTAADRGGRGGGGEDGGGYARVNPALNLNLYLLASASCGGNYGEALKLLSSTLAFFQAKRNFDQRNSALFPPGLERLSLELVSLDMQALNNLWSILGAKYLPSAMYKLRMLTFQAGWIIDQIPAVAGAHADTQPRS